MTSKTEPLDTEKYYRHYEMRMPGKFPAMTPLREGLWHLAAGLTVGLGLWYLVWRWTSSLNPDAIAFSVAIATAETLAYLGTILFFYDIWKEGDTPRREPPTRRQDFGGEGNGPIRVDIFLTTYDESLDILDASLSEIQKLHVPKSTEIEVFVLDDGRRSHVEALAKTHGATYLARDNNQGFKAGNLKNGLFQSRGDFIVILDADTRILPDFLNNTLGYFRDPAVAWVQTPHWFYDIPTGERSQKRGWRRLFGRGVKDPFMADPQIFFDIIQRRRNRHNASFCCGAGSIHRREAIFEEALQQAGRDLESVSSLGQDEAFAQTLIRAQPLQPFRFHVSEDIYTSILMQSDAKRGWKSVYHPPAETRMLSPWSVDAWTAQKLKYAGGTFDIMFNANPLFKKGMRLPVKLHYAATFWSYLSILWLSVLLVAPVLSLLTGVAPVKSYSVEFFSHLLPPLIMSEIAMMLGCKGYSTTAGRMMSIGCLPIQWKAFWLVLRGLRPRFPPTPKVPGLSKATARLMPSLCVLGVILFAMAFGAAGTWQGWAGYTPSKMLVNLFWCAWNGMAVWMVVRLIWWSPEKELAAVAANSEQQGN